MRSRRALLLFLALAVAGCTDPRNAPSQPSDPSSISAPGVALPGSYTITMTSLPRGAFGEPVEARGTIAAEGTNATDVTLGYRAFGASFEPNATAVDAMPQGQPIALTMRFTVASEAVHPWSQVEVEAAGTLAGRAERVVLVAFWLVASGNGFEATLDDPTPHPGLVPDAPP